MKTLAVAVAAGLGLSCCITSPVVATPESRNLFVDGASAKHLSRQGMLEIAAIPYHHAGIRRPVFHIMVTDPDRAEVRSGREPKHYGDMFTVFEVRKKAGHWRLVSGSVKDTEWVQSYSHIIPAPEN
jgi:hypothetical protein